MNNKFQITDSIFRDIIEHSHDTVLVLNTDFDILYANKTFEKLFNYSSQKVIGKNFLYIVDKKEQQFIENLLKVQKESPQQTVKLEFHIKPKDNEEKTIKLIANNLIFYDGFNGIILHMYDVTGIKQDHEILHKFAFHDTLSGISNRALFREKLKFAIAYAKRYEKKAGIISIDLDLSNNPGVTNDIDWEDEVLQKAGETILNSLRRTDTVSRQGSDEFLIVLNDLNSEEDAILVAQKVYNNLTKITDEDKYSFKLKPYLGLSIYPSDASSPEQLITFADIAMSEAKNIDKNIVRIRSKDIKKPIFRTEKQFS